MAEQRNEELEARILDNPGDRQAYLVYADWLQGRGEPRGELIALLSGTGTPEVTKAVDTLFAKHGDKLLGPLAEWTQTSDHQKGETFTWELGFIKAARFAHDDFADEARSVQLSDGVRALLSHPSGRLLQELTIGLNRDGGGQCEYGDIIAAIAEVGSRSLRSLFVGDFEYPDETEISWTNHGSYESIWSKLPRLERMVLQGGEISLGEIHAPNLKHLEIRTGGLSGEVARSIGAARFPELETLIVWTGDENYGATTGLDDLAGILTGDGLPKLRRLGLMNSQLVDSLVRAVADSPVLRRLEELDLSMGIMSDEGRLALIERKQAFAHLKRLNLENNQLVDTSGLEGICPDVNIGEQRDAEYRYVMVGE